MGKTSKVVFCGMKGVGKTAILEQLIYGNVSLKSCFYPTIEDIYVANIETDRGSKERVCFYDTAGLEPPLTGEFKGSQNLVVSLPTTQGFASTDYDQPKGKVHMMMERVGQKMAIPYCMETTLWCSGPPQSPTMQLTSNQVLQRHYIGFAEGFVLVYDTTRPESLDVLVYLKKDIDRNKDKKEVVMIVIGNRTGPEDLNSLENTVSKAANWCAREKVRHFEVTAMDRASLYEPFIYLTTRLNPVQNKTSFPQLSTLSKLTQKNNRSDVM